MFPIIKLSAELTSLAGKIRSCFRVLLPSPATTTRSLTYLVSSFSITSLPLLSSCLLLSKLHQRVSNSISTSRPYTTMEDVQTPPEDAPVQTPVLPEGNADPEDPLNPEVEEENNPDAPIGYAQEDVELTGENEIDKDGLDDGDNESELSDVDEAQFEDFDPANIAIEDRPVDVDASNVNQLKAGKRKRDDGDDAPKKKKKEGRRDKPKKSRKKRDEDEHFSGGEELEGKRSRGRKEKAPRARTPDDDDMNLTPEERKYMELNKYESLSNPPRSAQSSR